MIRCENDRVNVPEMVRQAESESLNPAVRRDPIRVGALLAPDFVEIGRSGRRWNRAEVMAALAAEKPGDAPKTDDWECLWLSDDVILVTYVIHGVDRDSRHASVWNVATNPPLLRFHQGTFIDPPPA